MVVFISVSFNYIIFGANCAVKIIQLNLHFIYKQSLFLVYNKHTKSDKQSWKYIMNSFLNQFKNSRGKYDAKKIFWELFGMFSLILVFIMISFIIY